MAVAISIKIEGLKELTKKFDDRRFKKKMIDATNLSMVEVNKRAMVEVPVDTSQLQKSHILSPATMNTARAELYTDLEYAVPVHEGHRLRGSGRQPANPWMKRAVESSSDKIEKIFSKVIKELLN